MDIAIVTGAETPLGLRLIKGLIRQGCRVHGIGNNFSKVTFADHNFIAHAIDLSDLNAVTEAARSIIEKEDRLNILIHAIDVTPGNAFEKLPVGNLEAVLKIGLLGPVMLTRLALPNLLRFRGQLINIIPGNKSGQPASAANALIEGGLREMNHALFDQARDAGLRITNLILRQNTASNLDAPAEVQAQNRIDPEHVARVIERLIDENDPNVPNEICLYPRLSAEAKTELPLHAAPVDPYSCVILPPKEYCPPEEPKIPTKQKENIDRTIPYTDEEMEDKIAAAIEDFESHPERYIDEKPKQARAKPQQKERKQPKQSEPKQPDSEPAKNTSESNDSNDKDGDNQSRRRRGRRRGGRNRNKPRPDGQQGGQPQQGGNQGQQNAPQNQSSNRGPRQPKQDTPRNEAKPQPNNSGERPTSPDGTGEPKKRPSRNRRGPSKPKDSNSAPKVSEAAHPKPDAKPQPTPKPSPAPDPVKAPAKKAAKKAVKKTATKKAAKKAVKKTATKKVAKKAVKKKAKPAE